MSFIEEEDIQDVVEGMFAAAFQETLGVELPRPFPRLTYADAMARYGSDKPDLRFGMEIVDVSDLAGATGVPGVRRGRGRGRRGAGHSRRRAAAASRARTWTTWRRRRPSSAPRGSLPVWVEDGGRPLAAAEVPDRGADRAR